MKDFFKEILVYNFEMNNKLIMLFENHPNEISEKAQLLLSHLINAQHLWNNRILKQNSAYKVWENLPLEVLKNMNAEKLEIDLSKVDTVILSHGHYDHSGGILPFYKINPEAIIYMQKKKITQDL